MESSSRMCVESQPLVSTTSTDEWKESNLKKILEDYSLRDILAESRDTID